MDSTNNYTNCTCSKEEYLMIRREIMQDDSLKHSVMAITYGFLGVILTYSLAKYDNIFMLIPYVVLFPAYKIARGKDLAIYRLGTYLMVFHTTREKHPGRKNILLNTP